MQTQGKLIQHLIHWDLWKYYNVLQLILDRKPLLPQLILKQEKINYHQQGKVINSNAKLLYA
jgi:hypothetical protein